MATKKIYTVVLAHNDRETEYTGTLDHLCTKVFGYTLEKGHSWNSKIPTNPRSAKTLVKALNDSACECGRYSDNYYLKA